MDALIKGLLVRFKEPSSWLAIGAGAAGLGFTLDAGLVQAIAYVGAGVCGLLGFFLPERRD